jgi:HEPN domain-containing protein
MKAETREWLDYAGENLKAARLTLENRLYNSCLQDSQQAIEKALKALLIEEGEELRKTHSIRELRGLLQDRSLRVDLSDEECDLLDSIYLPSKYPLGPALPPFDADEALGERCLTLADRVVSDVTRVLRRT